MASVLWRYYWQHKLNYQKMKEIFWWMLVSFMTDHLVYVTTRRRDSNKTSCWNTLWTIYEFNPRDIWKYRQSREIKIILKIKFPNLWPLEAFVLNKLHMHNTEVQSFLFVCCDIKKIFVKSPHNVCHTQLLLFHWSDVFHKKKRKPPT